MKSERASCTGGDNAGVWIALTATVLLAAVGCGSSDGIGDDATASIVDESEPASNPIAATVFVDRTRIDVERSRVEELSALIEDDVVATSILFEDESSRHIRAAVTQMLIMDAITSAFVPEPVANRDLEDVRVNQARQLAGELIYYNEVDPVARADEMTLTLRPWLDVVAQVGLKRRSVVGFIERAEEVDVLVDPTIGVWDRAELVIDESAALVAPSR
ncbi:MAG: hypothetical protein ACR2P0_06220 [Acidimicrobiales bacterium]